MALNTLSLQTNVASLKAQNSLGRVDKDVQEAMARLSSGMRINVASDDAAGLAISEKLKAQIRSLSQAQRNANDGISLLQTAEAGMNETSNMLIRIRELAMQSANGTLGDSERESINDEFTALIAEIDRVAASTEFNGVNLIDGTLAAGVTFQIGIDNTPANDQITVSITSSKAVDLGLSTTMTLSTVAGATAALTIVDDAITAVSARRGHIGAAQNRLAVTINNLSAMHENLSAANSRIRDADVASESAKFARSQILIQAGTAMLAQANQLPQLALKLIG